MTKSGFTEAQIMGVLRLMKGGIPAIELRREHGMSSVTLYKWRVKYGGMDASRIIETKSMAEEDRRVKRMYACINMQNAPLKEALEKRHGQHSALSRPCRMLRTGSDRWISWLTGAARAVNFGC